MTDARDLAATIHEVANDEFVLRELVATDAYKTLEKYLDAMLAEANRKVLDPNDTMDNTRHWRGVYTGVQDVKTIHQGVKNRLAWLRSQQPTTPERSTDGEQDVRLRQPGRQAPGRSQARRRIQGR